MAVSVLGRGSATLTLTPVSVGSVTVEVVSVLGGGVTVAVGSVGRVSVGGNDDADPDVLATAGGLVAVGGLWSTNPAPTSYPPAPETSPPPPAA
ncbi:MAG: hypothetical protein EHM41_00925 [Chloroflexi bacterium]|nr:MAG: hypothetical protein EHM41_00925 [Chloroflexota bacterium]